MSKIETTSQLSLKLTSRINLGRQALNFGHNSQSPYPGASKSVARSLKCTGPYHRFLLEYAPKTSCLKENILRKKSIVEQRFIQVEALFYTAHNFIKNGVHARPFYEALKNLIYLQNNLLGGVLFQQSC